MSGSAWTALQPVLKGLTPRQRKDYDYRVNSWFREMGRKELPHEALLVIAQAVANHTQPNGQKIRAIVEQFPPSPRPAA